MDIGRRDSEQPVGDGSLHISGKPCHLQVVARQPTDWLGLPGPEHVQMTP